MGSDGTADFETAAANSHSNAARTPPTPRRQQTPPSTRRQRRGGSDNLERRTAPGGRGAGRSDFDGAASPGAAAHRWRPPAATQLGPRRQCIASQRKQKRHRESQRCAAWKRQAAPNKWGADGLGCDSTLALSNRSKQTAISRGSTMKISLLQRGTSWALGPTASGRA